MPRPNYVEAWISESPAEAAADGTARAERLILKMHNGASDPEAALRAVLDVAAESGRIIAPDSRLRAFCARLQQQLATARRP